MSLPKANETFKNNHITRKPAYTQQKQPILTKLKKKNVVLAQKPLRMEGLDRHPQVKPNKLQGEQLNLADRIYFKKEEERERPMATPRGNKPNKPEKKENSRMKQSVREPIRMER